MEGLEIEIMGHRAKIESVLGRLAYPPWQPEDRIYVSFCFDQAVDSTLGFAIDLPVKNYTRDEFLRVVKREGERELEGILQRSREERQKRKQEEERQKVLDSIASEIKASIGLT